MNINLPINLFNVGHLNKMLGNDTFSYMHGDFSLDKNVILFYNYFMK